jgi:hypothetical protein
LGVVDLACAKQGIEGVVPWDDETCEVDEEGAADVEENQEEVNSDQAEEGIDLGDAGLLLEIVERRILGELR